MHCHRILVSALFADMSSLLISFISKKYFLLLIVSFSFCTLSDIYFFNVALVAVAAVEAAVGIVELQIGSQTKAERNNGQLAIKMLCLAVTDVAKEFDLHSRFGSVVLVLEV